MKTTNKTPGTYKIKKGDTIVEVGVWSADFGRKRGGPAVHIGRPMAVESFGKTQGTATSIEDGRFVKHRIYANLAGHFLFLVDDEAGISEALKERTRDLRARLEAAIRCQVSWLTNHSHKASPGVVGQAKANLAEMERLAAYPALENETEVRDMRESAIS